LASVHESPRMNHDTNRQHFEPTTDKHYHDGES
jgi:hypothetical protein